MRARIFAIVASAVEELNEELQYDSLKHVEEETPLYDGSDNALDSLSLVTLVSTVEAEVNDAFDAEVLLASEKAMSMKRSPYRSVGALVDFIEQGLRGV